MNNQVSYQPNQQLLMATFSNSSQLITPPTTKRPSNGLMPKLWKQFYQSNNMAIYNHLSKNDRAFKNLIRELELLDAAENIGSRLVQRVVGACKRICLAKVEVNEFAFQCLRLGLFTIGDVNTYLYSQDTTENPIFKTQGIKRKRVSQSDITTDQTPMKKKRAE